MGRAAQGVNGLRLRAKDEIVAMIALTAEGNILTASEKGYGKRSSPDEYRPQHRGGRGIIGHKVTEKTGEVVAALQVVDDDEIVIISSQGVLLRTKVSSISRYHRSSQGVKLMRIPAGHAISGVARVVESDEENLPTEEGKQKELPI